jgi:putative ABC transport system permease protein
VPLAAALTVARLGLASLPQRKWSALSAVLSIAMVIAVLVTFLAMAAGFRSTLRGSGEEDVAIALQTGAPDEASSAISSEEVALLAGLVGTPSGRPVSAEAVAVVALPRATGGAERVNIAIRGVDRAGLALHPAIQLTAGRMFRPGTDEIVAGRGAAGQAAGLSLGNIVRTGGASWRVVGVFEARGSLFESELLGDRAVIQTLFGRPSVNSVRLPLDDRASLESLERAIAADPRLNVTLQTDRAFFASQSRRTVDLIQRLGWPLAIVMAIGAIAGALNTMYATVQVRTREIVTLRILGFRRGSVFVGTLIESVLLALVGAAAGLGLASLAFDGLSASTLGGGLAKVVFTLQVTFPVIAQSLLFACLIGILGGFFPAARAARLPLTGTAND